jgi:hypothetical protein
MIAYEGVVHVCLPPCDPLLQACPFAATCVPVDASFFCLPDESGKSGQIGTGCADINDCEPGLVCAHPDVVPECADAGCCTELCDTTLADPDTQCSAAGQGVHCLPWYEDGRAPPGWEDVGACVIPS